jgi:uncharacterized repeat protein (TIGR02543 family)
MLLYEKIIMVTFGPYHRPYGVSAAWLPAAPSREGYIFAGWNTAADGTGAAFDAATLVTADITVYAQWVLPYTYIVTFNSNGGDTEANPPSKIVDEPAATVGALPAPPTN